MVVLYYVSRRPHFIIHFPLKYYVLAIFFCPIHELARAQKWSLVLLIGRLAPMTVLVLGVGNGVVFQAASLRYRETTGTAISRHNSWASCNADRETLTGTCH